MNAARLIEFFGERRERGESLVLASVVDTGGSTYSKAGELMLISEDGEFCGMLSGGCLEGDLVARSKQVLRDGEAQMASFDLSQDDELWGLGIGCEGSMNVWLQSLLPQDDYQPFVDIVELMLGRVAAAVQLSVQHRITVSPIPTLLVLGAGADAEPIVNMALELGWRCTVIDHRPAYVESRKFGRAAQVRCLEAGSLSQELELSDFDMALVMSHHLTSDRCYLEQLAATDIQYVGLLGPPKRRDRLLNDLGGIGQSLVGRLRAPAGMELGGRGPGPIAVEIVAEMQQFLSIGSS